MRWGWKAVERRTGIPFVYVTHDQAEALALSDRIAVMSGGRLQQFGTPREVYERPANRLVADFMGLVNLLPALVAGRDGAGALVQAGPFRLAVALAPEIGDGDAVEIAIRPESIRFLQAGEEAGAVRAKVKDQSYLGNLSEYLLELDGGLSLRAQASARVDHAVGTTVLIAVDAAQCSVFRREEPSKP